MSQASERATSNTFVVFILILWFLLVAGGSALGVFQGHPSRPPLILGTAVILPVLVFVSAWSGSARFRRFILSMAIRATAFAQIGRILGGVFLILYAQGVLPGIFAFPAGLGDVAIGLTAPLIAWMLVARTRLRLGILALWNVLGLLDLIMAVSLGILTSQSTLGILAGATTSAAVVTFPLSLIPTFLVPFYLILHLIALGQVRRHWASSHGAAPDGAVNEVAAPDLLPQTHV